MRAACGFVNIHVASMRIDACLSLSSVSLALMDGQNPQPLWHRPRTRWQGARRDFPSCKAATGSENVSVGHDTMSTGGGPFFQNTGVGNRALRVNTGSRNTAVGDRALQSNTTGTDNVGVGKQALSNATTVSQNTAVGAYALDANTSGMNNAALGFNALKANTTASQNTAVGAGALGSNTSGTNNAALGFNALAINTTASNSTAVGHNALLTSIGAQNTAMRVTILEAVGYGTFADVRLEAGRDLGGHCLPTKSRIAASTRSGCFEFGRRVVRRHHGASLRPHHRKV